MNVQGGRSFVTVKMTVDLAYNLQKQILYTLLVASYPGACELIQSEYRANLS